MTLRSTGARRAVLVGLAVASLLAGCSSAGSDAGAPPPQSAAGPGTTGAAPAGEGPRGFGAVTVVVTLPDGSTRELCLWLADTGARRQQGLMGVSDPGLGGLPGMVFRFDRDTTSGFWMKDTLLPLSIAWYAADGRLVSTTDMEPCPADAEACPSYSPAGAYRLAVEVPQGALDEVGLVEGSSLALGEPCTAPSSA